MKVKECEKCEYYERRRWSHIYYPNGYHAIGMTHAFGYCTKHKRKCREVKKCKEGNDE